MREPATPGEWQEAVDSAHLYLLIDSAEKYGLLTGPEVNVERCEEILSRGRALGYEPRSLT